MNNRENKSKPARPRSDTTHKAILAAASTILKEEGYAKLTIEGIARLSGAGKPTIYRWWPSKMAILIELYDNETTKLLAIDETGVLREELTQWFMILWSDWQNTVSGETYRSILAEIQSDPKGLAFFNKSYIPKRRAVLMQILERARQRGELQGRNLEAIVDYCCGFNWYYLLTHTVPSDSAIEEIVRSVTIKQA
ncbi:MAG TPA: TetR/AcrR family transcriptional regulator [Candidatus Saccharimonadales bacterium]|nr:TetR/AcrR family transcriptional regulator [Candidatus Saccharimonadales bacterium]